MAFMAAMGCTAVRRGGRGGGGMRRATTGRRGGSNTEKSNGARHGNGVVQCVAKLEGRTTGGRKGRTGAVAAACAVSATSIAFGDRVQNEGRERRLVVQGKGKKLQKPGLPPKGRVCQLTGKKRLNSTYLTFSHKRIKNVQYPNLQNKKIFWEEGQRWVKLRICTKAMKTLDKKGLDVMAREAGLNLWLLPHKKFDPEREEWKKQNPYPAQQLPTRFKKRKKWQLPNSLRGAKAFVSDEESRPMVGDVVNGKFVPRAAPVDSVVEQKRNIIVNRRVADDAVNPFEDMVTQFESLSTSSESSEAALEAEVPTETPAKEEEEEEDAPESES